MNKIIGKVISVYVPEQYKNGKLLDVMDRTNIGFKVITDNGIKDIVLEENESNVKIMKDDLVWVKEEEVLGKSVMDIELYGGENNE